MIEYFPKQYAKLRLNEYAPLDIGEIEKRIAEGFPKYTCDKYTIDPVKKEITRIIKGTGAQKLLFKL